MKYYAQNMTGTRIGSLPSSDGLIDTYTVLGSDGVVRVLTGVRQRTGTWYVQLNNLTSVGLPASGALNIHTFGFPTADDAHFEGAPSIIDYGYYAHPYSDGQLSFPVFQNDVETAYSFTFAVNSSVPF